MNPLANWHDLIAVAFVLILICDFVVFPAISLAMVVILHQAAVWNPLTLQAGGMFFVAMGGILGAGAWRRCVPDSQINPTP